MELETNPAITHSSKIGSLTALFGKIFAWKSIGTV